MRKWSLAYSGKVHYSHLNLVIIIHTAKYKHQSNQGQTRVRNYDCEETPEPRIVGSSKIFNLPFGSVTKAYPINSKAINLSR